LPGAKRGGDDADADAAWVVDDKAAATMVRSRSAALVVVGRMVYVSMWIVRFSVF
jgi:hypothetical protein